MLRYEVLYYICYNRTKNKLPLGNVHKISQKTKSRVARQVEVKEININQFEQQPSANAFFAFFVKNDKTKEENINWKKNITNLSPSIRWYEQALPEVMDLKIPLHSSEQYFTENLYKMISSNTNMYAVQNSKQFRPTNVQKLTVLVGIYIIMGNTHYPPTKDYWQPRLRIFLVANNMAINRIYKLRQPYIL